MLSFGVGCEEVVVVRIRSCSVHAFVCRALGLSRFLLRFRGRWVRVGGVIKVCRYLAIAPRHNPAANSHAVISVRHTELFHSTDLDPIRRKDRKWSVWALIAYWFSDAFNAATWEFASSILAIGLSYRDAVGIVATGFLIISFVIALNGATGVLYHAPFPVLARAGYVLFFYLLTYTWIFRKLVSRGPYQRNSLRFCTSG